MLKFYLSLIAVTLLASGCAVNSIEQGSLESGIYQSSTQKFTIPVPDGAKIFDGTHALGEYVAVNSLPKPLEVRGVSYNRVANVDEETSELTKDNIIKSGYDFWRKGYAGIEVSTISSEWIELDGRRVYFTVLEGQPAGLLVKPNTFYGTLNFLKDGYGYVVFERIRTEKMLIGAEGRPTGADAELRKNSILAFYRSIKFH
ncbi:MULTISPECIES: hypothetical protein [unclassified Lentilitoribacter]|jgi:hypothetical protein|uniref:hypothetical protein n=1 Tax=unclassified Lentilitoribacter TaxID=2647570 RepID=UPI0013A6DBBE|nr:hypothetical protein [Lentilitoribacter sp. Alg239-R112]